MPRMYLLKASALIAQKTQRLVHDLSAKARRGAAGRHDAAGADPRVALARRLVQDALAEPVVRAATKRFSQSPFTKIGIILGTHL